MVNLCESFYSCSDSFVNLILILMVFLSFSAGIKQVKKIVQGSFNLFQSMYRPLLREYASDGLLKISSVGQQQSFKQVLLILSCSSLATLFIYLENIE